MTHHWANEYIGIPWRNGAQGPDAFDCWAFVRHIQCEHYGVVVPPINVDASHLKAVMVSFSRHPELVNWERIAAPEEGCCVLLANGRYPAHVGVWVAGALLHCQQPVGVVYHDLLTLRNSGWGQLQYYRHKAN